MQVKSIDVEDYSSGSKYIYTDQSGTWQSIKAEDGDTNGDGNAGGNSGGNDNGNDSGDDDGDDNGNDDGESGSGPDSDSPTVTEGPSATTDSNESTGMATGTEYPWVPNPTDTQDSGSPVTSYAGLPSDWTVSDTGRALPPNSASVSEPPPVICFMRHPCYLSRFADLPITLANVPYFLALVPIAIGFVFRRWP